MRKIDPARQQERRRQIPVSYTHLDVYKRQVQYLFRQTYRLQGNETILFHAAAGGVGLIACQWARALGVKLIGTVSSPEKAELALSLIHI